MNKKCLKKFEYAKNAALQINEYLNKGFLVIDESDDVIHEDSRFEVDEENGEIYLKLYYGSLINYFDIEYGTLKEIKNILSKFRIIDPKNIIKLKKK